MKTGLFFGSFNPIHTGHLIVANTMAATTDLEQVWLVVTPRSPFKKNANLAHEFDRIDMVERAIADNHCLFASDVEFHLPKPSYTIDTLTYLQEKYPDRKFVLIVGEDNLLHFHKWKNHERILEYYEVYYYPRPGIGDIGALKDHPKVTRVAAPLLDISASFIRRLVKQEKSIQYLVHPEVERYIRQKKLYL